MTNIKNYLDDGAVWQAQMVLAYVRAHSYQVTDGEPTIQVGRHENCREQGYVFIVRIPGYLAKDGKNHQMNWAVYEHRNSDNICVLSSTADTINTPTIEEMWEGRKDKWDYDKDFRYNQAYDCGEFLISEMKDFVTTNYRGERE